MNQGNSILEYEQGSINSMFYPQPAPVERPKQQRAPNLLQNKNQNQEMIINYQMAPPSAAKVTIKGSPQQNLEKNIAISPHQFEYSQAELQTPSPQVIKTSNQNQYESIDARNQNAPSRNIVQSTNQRMQSHDMPKKPPQVN